jgi:hypothetical protein
MIKLTNILLEVLTEDRCKRIADRRYSKPSAYKSGAIVRCRKGKIWKGLKEEISAEEAQDDVSSLQTIIDKKRNVGFFTLEGINSPETFWEIVDENNLKSLEVEKNPHDAYIIYRPGSEKEANELKDIANKYNGYLSYKATDEDTRRIGQLLGYKAEDIETYIERRKSKLNEAKKENKYEGLEDTSWTNADNKKLTLKQLLDVIKNYPTTQVPIEKLKKIVIKKDSGGIETPRLDKADVKYPIIIVIDDNNNFRYILDGNHRVQKAMAAGLKSIPAKLLNIKDLPEKFQGILSEAKKETLRTWFKRKGAPGKTGGWVDCNTCRDGKCKPCGRKKGEVRSKYPSCRPTPSQCKRPGKGKTWGKTK